MASRQRQIYNTSLVYVGPTGNNPATGQHYSLAVYGVNQAIPSFSGANLVNEMFRIQKADFGWNKALENVNQFGELAAIDRIPLRQPTVNLSLSWILANLVNESLMGFDVNSAGDLAQVTCISGILAGVTIPKNYFIKVVSEGNDAISNASAYNVIAIGNGFIDSYTAQGAVGGFPTADCTIAALNIQGDSIGSSNTTGAVIPAVNLSNGTTIPGWFYNLPTGTTTTRGVPISSTNTLGVSALRPGDITFNLGLAPGDLTLVDPTDIKVQSFNFSFNLNQEDLLKLGSKFAYAKVPRFPVDASLTITALAGDVTTGNLVNILNNNGSFNPTVTLNLPGTSTAVVQYALKGAKLDSEEVTSSIGANESVTIKFSTQLGSAQATAQGVYMSGIETPNY
jgi:hypothetical protein